MNTSQKPRVRSATVALTIVMALSLYGCATPDSDRSGVSLGRAVREAKLLQTIDVSAAQRAPAERGADAGIAVSAWQRYQDSFKAPPQSFEIFGIGGASR